MEYYSRSTSFVAESPMTPSKGIVAKRSSLTSNLPISMSKVVVSSTLKPSSRISITPVSVISVLSTHPG